MVTDDTVDQTGISAVDVGIGDTPAVLVIDLQRAFTTPEHELGADLSAVIEQTNQLISVGRDIDAPIIFTRHVQNPHTARVGMNQKVPALDTLVPDSEWIEIDDRLDCREEDLIIEKTQASAFHATELDDYLSAMGIDSVLVAGTTTSGCIRAGATDSCSNGYRTTIPKECVGDRSPEQGKANLLDLDARYADVRSLQSIITDLRGVKHTA